MSWAASLEIEPGVGLTITSMSNVESDEHREQFEAAKNAVVVVLNSGALGDPTYKYKVVLSGHGNPGHEPTAGWSNDLVNISIYQLGPEAE